MAIGDTLIVLTPHHHEPPAADFASLDERNGHLVLDFDDTTGESAHFAALLPRQYGGGGLTVTLVWMATSATSGNVVWTAAFERHADDATDLDADHFAAPVSIVAGAASAAGEPRYTEMAFDDGEPMGGLLAGESFRLRIARDADHESDTLSGDAELLRVEIRET